MRAALHFILVDQHEPIKENVKMYVLRNPKSIHKFSLKSSALTEMSISIHVAPWVITVTAICSDPPETASVNFFGIVWGCFCAPQNMVLEHGPPSLHHARGTEATAAPYELSRMSRDTMNGVHSREPGLIG